MSCLNLTRQQVVAIARPQLFKIIMFLLAFVESLLASCFVGERHEIFDLLSYIIQRALSSLLPARFPILKSFYIIEVLCLQVSLAQLLTKHSSSVVT